MRRVLTSRGTTEHPPEKMPESPPYNPYLLQAGAFPFAAFERRKAELRAAGKRLFDFGVGDPVEPTPDFIRKALAANIPAVSQYPHPQGIPELRAAVAGYLLRRFGAKLDADGEIMPTGGSKEAVFNLTFLFGGPGAARNLIIGPAPGYFVVEKSAIMNGMEFYPFELNSANGCLMDLGSLPPAVLNKTAVAWINYPHNPTGASCTLDYLRQQTAVAHKFGFLLCSDECYCDIYHTAPPPSILQITKDGVLAFHSCSKRSGMTAYRSGFVAGDREVIRRYVSYRNIIGAAPPVFTQHAARAAWSDDAHADERRAFFFKKREVMLEFLSQRGFNVFPNEATFYLWIEAPGGLSAQSYAERLLEGGIVVSPGDFFGERGSRYFRIALAPALPECRAAAETWRALDQDR